jgi:hypothetical protein
MRVRAQLVLVLVVLVVLEDARLRSMGSVGGRGGRDVRFVRYVVSLHFPNRQLADEGFLDSLALLAPLAAHIIHSVCESMIGIGSCHFLARILDIDILDIVNSTFQSPMLI